ncbi:hypothetical protein RJ639_045324 [Escallonia herrerae]|uniref:Uncharacterized protein n=1 Tax=Escallonia herrerae TaxID=1293975 RepID=A0AA89AYL7_9ASTE|nr:hypothetical protein RJ639_045324 [Escallonia herrerae]
MPERSSPLTRKLFLTSYSTTNATADGGGHEDSKPGPPPIQVLLTESAGRGVFGTRRIGSGELIHTAKPVVSHPSLSSLHKVCHFCLKTLVGKATVSPAQTVAFCSEECSKHAKGYYEVEKHANWSAFDDHCRTQGLKYPLLVKRFACMVISGVVSADSLDNLLFYLLK